MSKSNKYEALKKEIYELKNCIEYTTNCMVRSRADNRNYELQNGVWTIRHELCPMELRNRFEDLMYDLKSHYRAELSKRLEKVEAIETLLSE